MDMSGPRLILKFDDSLSILRNVMKVKTGDDLTCVLSDAFGKNEINITAIFEIMSMPVNGEIVTLNCLLSKIASMKTPAIKPTIFPLSGNSLSKIIGTLTANAFTTSISVSTLLNSYHLLPGERPSMLLRQMAIEHGAAAYVSRDKLFFTLLSELNKTAPDATKTFHYKNPREPYQIVDYAHINRDELVSDRLTRKYTGFSLGNGFIPSTTVPAKKDVDAPSEMTAYYDIAIIDNLPFMAIPILDIVTIGAGHLTPGIAIKMQWNTDFSYNDSSVDESLPTQAIVGAVSHYTNGASNYYCRVKLIKVAE
jgi:hypothetical protein